MGWKCRASRVQNCKMQFYTYLAHIQKQGFVERLIFSLFYKVDNFLLDLSVMTWYQFLWKIGHLQQEVVILRNWENTMVRIIFLRIWLVTDKVISHLCFWLTKKQPLTWPKPAGKFKTATFLVESSNKDGRDRVPYNSIHYDPKCWLIAIRGSMMSSFRPNSIQQNVYVLQLQGSVFFSLYHNFSLISMIFTSFNTPNTFMNARTKKLTFQSSQWHRMCVCMPLMYFQPQCYLGSEMKLNGPWSE